MPVIPYTLCITCLWRNSPSISLVDSPSKKAHGSAPTDSLAVVAAVIALFFYMPRPAPSGMQGLRGVSGPLQLRYCAGSTVAEATKRRTAPVRPIARG